MNIGIDIDGTLTKHPEFFRELGLAWKARGHKVFVVTGLGESGLAERRVKWPILDDTSWYDSIITTKYYNKEERDLIHRVESNEIVVGHFKQRICREMGIAVMFDDQALIHRHCGNVPIFQVQ